ncbi:hypothetical protein PCANC_27104 [Puccinia coronata f. sp. avenae]|uniref:Integrase zinc-binding domain-containing protein n=1 Tax=Puccinia coronata f. sp. avenae TaxID=200324 RepID=A0A2N5S7G1_9BASI|nr:hypothetical protein PCANC_27104 [Puccinia coronata f. sp. avenae]
MSRNTLSVLMVPTKDRFCVTGASLDEANWSIDIGEVAVPYPLSPPLSPADDDPVRDAFFCPPSPQLCKLLKEAYNKEPPAGTDINGLEFWDGLWWIWDRVFVPSGLRSRVLKDSHEKPTSRHPGCLKTFDLLTCTMNWPGVCKDMISY